MQVKNKVPYTLSLFSIFTLHCIFMFYLNFKFLIVFMYPKLAYKQYFHSFLFIEIFLNHSFKLSFNSFLFLFSCSIFINTKPTNFCYFFFNFISIFRMYIYLPIYLAMYLSICLV